MKIFFRILLLALVVTSCDDVEPTVFNGNDPSNQTFVSFSQTVYNLPIVRDEDGSATLVLNVSTISNVDRVYNLAIDQEASTANPLVYTFPQTITVPAGSYQGTAEVTGTDINVDTAITKIVFSITNITNESADTNIYTVNVFEVCPLMDDFTGAYRVEQLDAGIGTDIIADGTVVTLVEGDNGFERTFDAIVYPEYTSATRTFTFSLGCGETFFGSPIEAPLYCTEDNLIKIGPADAGNAGTYDTNDDTEFELIVTEDTSSSCGAPVQTRLKFTKEN